MDDELRALVEPLLLPWPERSPGPRACAGRRLCLQGILFALYNDRAWRPPPLESGVGSGQTCWRRLDRWQRKSQADNNRQAICGATKFTKDPTITDDSCDEFPFAGTYESGALNGVDHGKDCAQVTAVKKGSGTGLPTVWPTVGGRDRHPERERFNHHGVLWRSNVRPGRSGSGPSHTKEDP
ncbi:hypothetical protein SCALM49S_04792 [Streptomyces californicus]